MQSVRVAVQASLVLAATDPVRVISTRWWRLVRRVCGGQSRVLS